MKHILLLFVVTFALFSCGNNTSRKAQVTTETKQSDCLEVLYFHGKQRCITCNAIEKLAKEVVDSLNNNKIVLKVIDISKAENEAIADKYEVTWSSLILDRGGKIEDLTEMGFSYAKNSPEEFKSKLLDSINKMQR
ncbi:MAG: nitrophenyl compound nitroreductase subunit ArsF family protein [Bacteroidaceae bacterium]